MKILILLVSVSILSVSAFGQNAVQKPVTPDVTIIQRRWFNAPGKSISIASTTPAPEDAQKESRIFIENQRESAGKARSAEPSSPIAQQQNTKYLPGIETYQYETKIRNNGDKTIKEIIWEYVFSDPATNQELGRRRFTSKETIRPGKIKKLTGRSTNPPSSTVSVTTAAAGKKFVDQYAEDIKIVRITYADGSFKQADAQ